MYIYYLSAFVVCCFGMFIYVDLISQIKSGINNFFSTFSLGQSPVFIEGNMEDFIKHSERLASSVWCLARLDGSKFCRFQNLYHFPSHKGHLVFLLNEYSTISGIESPKLLKQINLSTVKNHSSFFLKVIFMKTIDYFTKKPIIPLHNNVFIMKRFKPDNIMHVIHDDLLPLFVTFQEMCGGDIKLCLSKHQLVFIDDNDEGPFIEWYNIFSASNPIFLTTLNSIICIKNSVIGLSIESVWFQYGFKSTQGPVTNTRLNGLKLKQFSDFVKKKLIVKKYVNVEENMQLVFFSRKINRKILNEEVVENNIKNIYHRVFNKSVDILNVDLSINTSKEIIMALQKSKLLIGMHGSGMILSMFLPEGSHIIEMFPFGIQPQFVSPVRALCYLTNVFYNYTAWINSNKSNTKTHPEYDVLNGGILHLPLSKQNEIVKIELVPPVECCHNPVYLFRMFQDTLVDNSFSSLLQSVFNTQTKTAREVEFRTELKKTLVDLWYFPPPVINLSCICDEKKLKVLWKYPFISLPGKVTFSVASNTGVTDFTNMSEITLKTQDCHQNQVQVWVKTLDDTKESIDSYVQCL